MIINTLLESISLYASYKILYYIVAVICIGGLFRWFVKPPGGLDLPTFDVTSDVVATIEKAHRQVYFCSLMRLVRPLTCAVQYPTTPFALSMPGMTLAVLPSSEIETVKALPESDVSIKY